MHDPPSKHELVVLDSELVGLKLTPHEAIGPMVNLPQADLLKVWPAVRDPSFQQKSWRSPYLQSSSAATLPLSRPNTAVASRVWSSGSLADPTSASATPLLELPRSSSSPPTASRDEQGVMCVNAIGYRLVP